METWSKPHYYLADAYNEMKPPTSDPTFLGSVSRTMYESMAAVDSDAVMVTQGWFLSGVPRLPWGMAQAEAFLRGPPLGKLLVLDLNAIVNPIWSKTQSFFNASFALSMISNFGERPGLFGRLPQLASAPPLALAGSAKGTMVGLGMAPEGINTNPIVFNLYAEMFWNGHTAPDLNKWVADYANRRYGLHTVQPKKDEKKQEKESVGGGSCEAHAMEAWRLLQRSVYSAPITLSSQGATASDMAARPAMSGGRIPDASHTAFYNTSDVEVAFSELVACTAELGDEVGGFAYDLVAVGRQVLSDRFNRARVAFAAAATGGSKPSPPGPSPSPAGPWQCVHFTAKDDQACAKLSGAKQLACETHICTAGYGGNFSHDADHNKHFPGCGTCWCCAKKKPAAKAPVKPVNVTEVKRLGAVLLGLIDDMDTLLNTHHAFLLGSWLQDAEGWAEQASTPAHGAVLMADARRILTIWGHPIVPSDTHDSGLSQYSYRLWCVQLF